MVTVGQQLTIPEAGWKRYDDRNPAIKYTGTWNVVTGDARFYNGTVTWINNPTNTSICFKFKGTKIRVIGTRYQDRSSNIQIKIDGVAETYSEYKAVSSTEGQILVYEKIGLSDATHDVEITALSGSYSLDAIDIDDMGRLFHPDEVTDPKDLDIGKRIRCHYQVFTSGQVGVFSGLGQETSDFIPPASSATPNGDFYFICVDKDHLGRWKLIADRNIQHLISWDALNNNGIASGSGLSIFIPKMLLYETPTVVGAVPNITAQVSYSTNNEWKAFDGNSATAWYTSTPAFNGIIPGPDGYWIQYDFGEGNEKAINYLSLVPLMYTGGSASIEKWVLKGSNDGVNFNTVASGTHANNENKEEYFFNNQKRYRYYRLYIRGYGNNGNVAGAREIKMQEYETFKNFGFVVRLLTGGVSSNDNKDNEWDKYIVNSTLNGAITAGDNNVWNWRNVYSWTSTTPQISSYPSNTRVVRGYSANNTWTVPTSGGTPLQTSSSFTTIGFRPVLLICNKKQLPQFSGNIDKEVVHKSSVNLSGTLSAGEGYTVSYQVLVNDQIIHQVSDFLPIHSINMEIPSSIMSLGLNTISLVAKDNENDSVSWSFYVTVVNDVPIITAVMKGLTLNLRIDEPETDKVQYRVELNGVQVLPPNGFTDLQDAPIMYQYTFKSSEVNIGSTNTLTIYVRDELGGETTKSITFVGDYSGIMFADPQGNFYSTDLGEVLKYLDFGAIIAGQTSLSVPVRLINKNGFKVTNIILSNDNNEQQPGARLEMSKMDLPFTPEDELFYSDVLDYNDELTFYVRLVTDVGTSPRSGKFTIFVKGDPTE